MDNDRALSVETAVDGDAITMTRLLVSVPSVNPSLAPEGHGEGQIAAVTAELLRRWGFQVETWEPAPGRPNVVGRLQGSGPTLLLNGHLDTVGVNGMTIDPFDPVFENGRIWGRGSCDMKGGVAAALVAARELSRSGPRPNLIVALTSDEEHASVGMAALVSRPELQADFAVVCEPTSLDLMPAHKGFVWVRALFRGRAAHGSRPEVGIDAIRHAGLYLTELDALSAELRTRATHPLLGHGSFHAGTISGGTAESVYPDLCELLLERRTLPGESSTSVMSDFDSVLRSLQNDCPELDATLEMTLERPGTEVAADDPYVLALVEAARAVGASCTVQGMSAWVDAAFLNEAGIPAVCFGPGSIEQAHTQDEWIDAGEIEQCAVALERFARGIAEET